MRPLSWVGTLYFGEGLPYALVGFATAIFYKNLHLSNTTIALVTSLVFLPWSLKPFWAPLLEIKYTKKQWIILFQMLESVVLFLLALVLFSRFYFFLSILFLILLAFFGASYDIVADGFYMLRLHTKQQNYFVGMRSLFYQLARLFTQGILIIGVGYFIAKGYLFFAWQMFFVILAIITFLLAFWHKKVLIDSELIEVFAFQEAKQTFRKAFRSFLMMPHFIWIFLFLLIYNLSDAQLLKIVPLFLLDRSGLCLSTTTIGFVYGLFAGLGMIFGCILGGIILNKIGVARSLKITTLLMVFGSMNYILLSLYLIKALWLITIIIFIPHFLFGLANSAYMGFLLKAVSNLPYRTTCYALGTAIMGLGCLIFGGISGYVQQKLGYLNFFIFNSILMAFTFFFVLFITFKTKEMIQ